MQISSTGLPKGKVGQEICGVKQRDREPAEYLGVPDDADSRHEPARVSALTVN